MPKRKKSDHIKTLDEISSDWKCTADNWRDKAEIFRKQGGSDEDTTMTLLQSRWELGVWDSADIDMCYEIIAECNTPSRAFSSCLEFGLIPPPEILHTLDEMFRTYSLALGGLTMEEVFFGKPDKDKGEYPVRALSDNRDHGLHPRFEKWKSSKKNLKNSFSLSIQAEEFFRQLEQKKQDDELKMKNLGFNEEHVDTPRKEVDIESFLRQHRRWVSRRANNEK